MANFFTRMKEGFKKPVSLPVKEKLGLAQEETNLFDMIRQGGFGGWQSQFIRDIYHERVMYPHEEMKAAQKIYLYNGHLQAAVNTYCNFLTGGEGQYVSKNPRLQVFLNRWYRDCNLKALTQYIFQDTVKLGNWYAERFEKDGKVVWYEYIPTPERMYHALDDQGMIEFFVLELPPEQLRDGEFVTIKYYGDNRKAIRGIKLERSKIAYVKMGVNTIPSYGRGKLAGIVNDGKVILEVERAMAVTARYKSIPKKHINFPGAAPKQVENWQLQFNQLEDYENPMTNAPAGMTINDMSYNGKELNFQPMLDYLKRKMTVAVCAEYLIHGEDTNRSTSREQKVGMMLNAKSEREPVKLFLINEARRAIAQLIVANPELNGEFDFEFGSFDTGEEDEKKKLALDQFQKGAITHGELREILGYEPDHSIADFYSFDLKVDNAPPSNNNSAGTPKQVTPADKGENDDESEDDNPEESLRAHKKRQ